jgi:hypothetical protein
VSGEDGLLEQAVLALEGSDATEQRGLAIVDHHGRGGERRRSRPRRSDFSRKDRMRRMDICERQSVLLEPLEQTLKSIDFVGR